MNNTIKIKKILLYYDRIEVFEAVDNIGGSYIAMLIDYDESSDKYIVTGVNPNRLRQFKVGLCDLRVLFSNRDSQNWYYASISGSYDKDINLEVQDANNIVEELLPDEGFFLHEYVSDANDLVLSESRSLNNVVVGLSLIPKEAYNHSIGLDLYKKALGFFQKMIKTALGDDKDFAFDVITPATAGSVTILLEMRRQGNLFCEFDLSQSLLFIDEINEDICNIPLTLERLARKKGHFVDAYRNFIEFISQNSCSINYSWATPQLLSQHQRLINENQAQSLFQELLNKNEWTIKKVDLEGYLSSINTKSKTGAWTLETDEGPRNGISKEGFLKGRELTVNKTRYRFSCEEKLTENRITGAQEKEYILLEYVRIE